MATQRSLEQQAMSSRTTDSSREFKLKELEGRTRALEKENEMLRQKVNPECTSDVIHLDSASTKSRVKIFSFFPWPPVLQLAGQASSSTLHIKTEELSRQYKEQLDTMKQEKDEEIQRLRVRRNQSYWLGCSGSSMYLSVLQYILPRQSLVHLVHSPPPSLLLQSQLTRIQTQVTTERTSSSSSMTTTSSSEKTLQLKISELLTMLEQRQTTITRQEEVCGRTHTHTHTVI